MALVIFHLAVVFFDNLMNLFLVIEVKIIGAIFFYSFLFYLSFLGWLILCLFLELLYKIFYTFIKTELLFLIANYFCFSIVNLYTILPYSNLTFFYSYLVLFYFCLHILHFFIVFAINLIKEVNISKTNAKISKDPPIKMVNITIIPQYNIAYGTQL
jgi:hypothetical protein